MCSVLFQMWYLLFLYSTPIFRGIFPRDEFWNWSENE